MRNPQRREEWQEAVDAADFMLKLDAARLYGLVTGGPEIDSQRCSYLLDRGKALGILPRPDNIKRQIEGIIDRERPRAAAAMPHRPPSI